MSHNMKPYLPLRIQSLLLDSGEFPAWPNRISLDWNHFSKKISSIFGKDIQVIYGKADWKKSDQLLLGLGDSPIIFTLETMPLEHNIYLAASKDSIHKISSWLIQQDAESTGFITKEIQEGFFRFLIIKSLLALEEMPISEGLTFHIKEEDIPFLENSYLIDVELKNKDHSAWIRCIFSKPFQESFKRHFATMNPFRDCTRLSGIEVLCQIERGQSSLTWSELRSLKTGDFLFLQNGDEITLGLTGKPLFHVTLDGGRITITDYADYYGVDMTENFDVISEDTPKEVEEENSSPKQKKSAESLREIPLLIRVEIARISLTMEKLLQLSPGDFLELGISTNDPVYLNVNGQRIGSGELLQLEDRVGIRILNINA
ncbi:MAG: type III secretion system cytoplasmic ring protein SctQ [Chlamydiales bacterium]